MALLVLFLAGSDFVCWGRRCGKLLLPSLFERQITAKKGSSKNKTENRHRGQFKDLDRLPQKGIVEN